MNFVSPGNGAFAGGGLFAASNPTNVAGDGTSRANTNTGAPGAGVGSGSINFARNNRGSNIRIPYSRLCPLESVTLENVFRGSTNAQMASSMAPDGFDDTFTGANSGRAPPANIGEYDGLDVGRVGFILGKRILTSTGLNALNEPQQKSNTNARYPSFHATGVDRMQSMCSFEYLFCYFSKTLDTRQINLKSVTTGDGAKKIMMRIKPFDEKATPPPATQDLTDIGDSVSQIVDVEDKADDDKLEKLTGVFPNVYKMDKNEIKQGLVINGKSPFLHAYGVMPRQIMRKRTADNSGRLISRYLGDETAIALLEDAMLNNGLFDYTPDGVVLSKLANGPDGAADAEFDVRDAQLFNVGVQGPCITSQWCRNPRLAVMPLDKVFILIVADLWWNGAPDNKNTRPRAIDGDGNEYGPELSSTAALQSNRFGDLNVGQYGNEVNANEGDGATLTNFRIMRSTSTHMTNDSYPILGKGGNKLKEHSRMGLQWGVKGAEVVIGGWCIGTVLDSAASRTVGHNMMANSNPTNMAINIDVHVEWWSGHKLHQHYFDNEGQIASRDGSRRKAEYTALDLVPTDRLTKVLTEDRKQVLRAPPRAP